MIHFLAGDHLDSILGAAAKLASSDFVAQLINVECQSLVTPEQPQKEKFCSIRRGREIWFFVGDLEASRLTAGFE